MDEGMLAQILMALAGSAPNEEFGVQPSQGNDLGMSDKSQMMGQVLNKMQGQGMAPPMPEEAGSGPAAEMLLMQLIQAMQEQDLGQMQGPTQQMQNPGTVGDSRELLRALLSGS